MRRRGEHMVGWGVARMRRQRKRKSQQSADMCRGWWVERRWSWAYAVAHTQCGCQVPFHAQIECLSGLVGTSLSATSPPPRFATGSGNSAWECIRIRIRCVCRGVGKPSQHSSFSRLETGDSRTELEAPTFHILAISKFRIGVYNSWRFTWRTKNYYLLSTQAASSSVCLCASQR